MGRVSIWAQWTIIAAGVVLCPVFVSLAACFTSGRSFAGYGRARRWRLGRRLGGWCEGARAPAQGCVGLPD
jgi:hypothetical protein